MEKEIKLKGTRGIKSRLWIHKTQHGCRFMSLSPLLRNWRNIKQLINNKISIWFVSEAWSDFSAAGKEPFLESALENNHRKYLVPFIDATQHPSKLFILAHKRIIVPRVNHWPQKRYHPFGKHICNQITFMKAQGLETALSATKCEKISLTATVSLKILDSSIEMGVGGNRFFLQHLFSWW